MTIDEQRAESDVWLKSQGWSSMPWDFVRGVRAGWREQERRHADDRETVRLIEELLAEEMPRIVLLSHDIEVFGPWTRDGSSQSFYGDSLLDCLRKAVAAKKEAAMESL